MLTIEKRQALTSLTLHPGIYSVEVTDFRSYDGVIESRVFIHAMEDTKREEILGLLVVSVGASFKKGEPHQPRKDGTQVFPYDLTIEGADSNLSTLFFDETVGKQQWSDIKEAPLPQGAEKMELLNDSTTTWNLEAIMRNEA